MTWPSTLTTTPAEHGKKSNKEKKPQDFLHLLDAIELVHGGYKFYLGVFQSRFFFIKVQENLFLKSILLRF